MLIRPDSLLLSNNEYKIASKVTYDDYVSTFEEAGSIQIIDTVSNTYGITTPLGNRYFLKYSMIPLRARLSVDDDIYTLQKIEDACVGDYYYLPKYSGLGIKTATLDISKHLIDEKYDVAIISNEYSEKVVGVPCKFLSQAIRAGVPDNQYFNQKIENYLNKKNYETIDDLKNSILQNNCKVIKKKISVNKGLICLAFLFLTGRYKVATSIIYLDVCEKDTELFEAILHFLGLHSISIDVTSKGISCNSSFIESLFTSEFDNMFFIRELIPKMGTFFSQLIAETRFITASEKTLHNIRLALYSLNTLSSINKFNDELFTLDILSPEDYVEVSSGFLLPILSIDLSNEPMLSFTIS